MGKNYKIVITAGSFFREFELPDEDISMKLGTTVRCDIRVALEACQDSVELELTRTDGNWTLDCPDNVYLMAPSSMRKQVRKQLEHGDMLGVRLQSNSVEIFTLDFSLNFDSVAKKYDKQIDIRTVNSLVIGGARTAALYANDPLLEEDFITLTRRQGKLYLSDTNARYGAYINGTRVNGEKELKNTDFFSLVGYSFYYKDGSLFTDANNGLRVNNNLRCALVGVHSGTMEYPKFVRNVRKKIILGKEPISVLDPPEKPQKQKNNLFLQLLPAVGSIALVVLLRGVMGGGGSFVIFSACSMALGAVTTIITFFSGNKDYKKDLETRETEYKEYIARKQNEIIQARQVEERQLAQIYLTPKTELDMLRSFSGSLFDREASDEDFLRICIGTGRKKSERPIKISTKESITVADDLAKLPSQLAEKYRYIDKAPVTIEAGKDNAVGVVGDEAKQYELLKIISLDLCTRHYYSDVKLFYILGSRYQEGMSWIRWLPHVQYEDDSMRGIVCDEASRTVVFDSLYVELSARENDKRTWPHYIVLVLDDCGLKSHPISKYISTASQLGFTFIFFETRQELLPQGCDEIIMLDRGNNRGSFLQVSNLNSEEKFEYNCIKDSDIQEAAITLSPIYSEEVSLENSLTKSITLFDLLGIMAPDDIDLEDNWRRAAIYRSMAAPLGVKSKNETVFLDLHERAHGPHGLVAGTTGSGKSETLQSYIISMAILYHPYEVGFVIIDFKGGGMANQFRDLPHLIGAITNIDGAAIQRSLKSIKAELQKRQRLFAEADVNKIDDYIKLFKNGQVSIPLPHLIIVVDEFAELKAQQPEFMDELISAARIGRSLGVHLILATQKPAGQVNEQIWSNSRFKLCLKVATPQDSNEVLKSPLAAEIREPGRAYLQIGNNELFELFQSAYSGGPAIADTSSIKKEFEINEVSFAGRREVKFQQKAEKTVEHTQTQLDAIVEYIVGYCQTASIPKLPDICLPDFADIIPYPENERKENLKGIISSIGYYDDPDMQYQGEVSIDHMTENALIIGSQQMGKTNLLQVIIRALAENYSPSEAVIYVLDFGSMVLRNYEGLAHVGGVVCSSEDEKLKNLFKLLADEMDSRKDRLMQIGVSSFASYKEAGYSDIPQIVLLIDNYTAFKELYLQEEDFLLPVLREGLTFGISVVMTNTQTSSIGFKYMSNIGRKIALYCNDAGEYSSTMGGRPRVVPRMTPGRAIVNIGNNIFEMQSFQSFAGELEIDRVNKMRAFVSSINQSCEGQKAKAIPVVPKLLDEECMQRDFSINRNKTYSVPIGLRYDPVGVISFDLLQMPVFGIMGDNTKSRDNLLRVLFNQLDHNLFSCPTETYVVDDIQHSLRWLSKESITKEYTANPNEILEIFGTLVERIKDRFDDVVEEGLDILNKEPLLVLIIHNRDAITALSKDAASMTAYKELLNTYKLMKFCIVFSNLEDAAVPFSGPEILKMLKENRNFIYTNKLTSLKFVDIPMAMIRKFKKDLEENDAYWFTADNIEKIKIVSS